jgi:hypothetical protein
VKTTPGLTLTGADERTSLEFLAHLAARFDFVEIGLLWSADPEERHRYPAREWLAGAIAELRRRCSAHVCGRAARQSALWINETAAALRLAGRVQLNGCVLPSELLRATELYGAVITQHQPAHPDYTALAVHGHALLVDASAGRGLLPAAWERPLTRQPVGFAGGLTPENLAGQLPRIHIAAASNPCLEGEFRPGEWWVDLETGLRDADDWFDPRRAWDACVTFERFRRELAQKGGQW